MTAAIQLFFEDGGGFGIGNILLTGGDQGGHPPLQSYILADRQARLPDEGAALKDLAADAQQRFAAVLACQARYGVAGSGIYRLEIRHRRGGTAGGAGQGQFVLTGAAVQTAAHGAACPGSVTIFVGNEACFVPFPAIDAVKHGDQESAPGGFAGFIGGLENVQALLEFQSVPLEFAKKGGHASDQQKNHSRSINFI